MNKSFSTSVAMPEELAAWIARQAAIRDTTVSALVRSLLRKAQAEIAAGIEPPTGWPHLIEPPQRVLASRPRKRDRRGRIRDPAGRFMPE